MVRVGVTGVQPDGRPIGLLGLLVVSLRPQQHPEVVVGVGVTGVKRDRLPVGADGIGEQPDRLEDDAEVAVPIGLVRPGLRLRTISDSASSLLPR